jgi:NADH-quinone oxidoreductase subunit L
MLMLVMANNFLQLFFGWEAVGLVSYLLIGFWFKRESAVAANLKAFLVNRVGDLGFILGIAAVMYLFGTLDYSAVFSAASGKQNAVVIGAFGYEWHWITLICLLLFVGAMGKSAQVPLHVWLPDSMEGPTPISALIHAATMVTAGIFLVARMSPLFELSTTALSVILIIGALTAFLMALVGLVQNDIKRVVAYSTLSQLGYMTVALGASAYSVAIFHLATHAFFKALLFLAAGSVIIALHHEQDMRRMGGLRRYMPITYITSVIGSLALAGIPPFAGFFSKDAIIEAVHHSNIPGAGLAYAAVLGGVVVTAFYSFRLIFMVFHGEPRMGIQARSQVKESPWVVTVPLILLAIPSLVFGGVLVEAVLDGRFLGDVVAPIRSTNSSDPLTAMGLIAHGVFTAPFWLALAGIVLAWVFYVKAPSLPDKFAQRLKFVYTILEKKYGFDEFWSVESKPYSNTYRTHTHDPERDTCFGRDASGHYGIVDGCQRPDGIGNIVCPMCETKQCRCKNERYRKEYVDTFTRIFHGGCFLCNRRFDENIDNGSYDQTKDRSNEEGGLLGFRKEDHNLYNIRPDLFKSFECQIGNESP